VVSWSTDGSLQILNNTNRSSVLAIGSGCTLVGIQGKKLTYIDKGQVKHVDLSTMQTTPFRAILLPSLISPNGEWWAGLRDEKYPSVWNARTLKLVSLGTPQAFYRPENRLFAFSGDSKWVAVAQGVRAFLFNLEKPDDPIQIPRNLPQALPRRPDHHHRCHARHRGRLRHPDPPVAAHR
jgi:hypothetical protein